MLSIVLAFGGVFVLSIVGYFYALHDTAQLRARKAAQHEDAPPG